MKKFGYLVAVLGAIAVAAPSIASAETIVIRHHGYGYHHDWGRAHAEYRMHRDNGLHRGWWHDRDRDRDRVVIHEHRERAYRY
ncbi:MAG TPA: hypothetical protein VKR55_22500 [Bradyrhizobium sp.]|uniref:hypothetical protein n=1 Tax=Bradyrhizobium sp. TaxID=376 RepID=UPI002BB35D21|nr:hypothetical protein [Bradyrhizobium sp.]HLZ04908.1 hypothetical protein [Bradyrhizobium sp.]